MPVIKIELHCMTGREGEEMRGIRMRKRRRREMEKGDVKWSEPVLCRLHLIDNYSNPYRGEFATRYLFFLEFPAPGLNPTCVMYMQESFYQQKVGPIFPVTYSRQALKKNWTRVWVQWCEVLEKYPVVEMILIVHKEIKLHQLKSVVKDVTGSQVSMVCKS